MSVELRRNKIVYEIIQDLVANGTEHFSPGHVADVLRQRNDPMGTWQIRGEFAKLADAKAIEVVKESGEWRLRPGQAASAAAS